jgi:hypothetical protein
MNVYRRLRAPPPGPRCFRPTDIQWALAWASVAPGGWSAEIVTSADGDEYLAVTSPGADAPSFLLDSDGYDGVWVWRPGRYDQITRHRSLRDAVMFLCPLVPSQLDALRAKMRMLEDEDGVSDWH